jgi:hypothetical protein
VYEVTRPKRSRGRHRGKNDLRDALAAAASVLADGDELAAPKWLDLEATPSSPRQRSALS